MTVREIKNEAKERFALNRYHAMTVYGVVYTLALNIAVLTTVLALLNIWAIWYGVVLIFLFFLMSAPFGFGMATFYLKLYRYEKVDAFHIFDGFNKYNLERVIVLRLLQFALWLAFTILLIVPGVIFSVRTSMATYLLRANPNMKPKEALRASNRVMKGHCGKYFLLSLSYIGWAVMGVVTCGLGFIWVAPYFNTAKTVFYKRELQGDKKVYRNPADDEAAAAEQVREQAREVYTKEQVVWNNEALLSAAAPDSNENTVLRADENSIPLISSQGEAGEDSNERTESVTTTQVAPQVSAPSPEPTADRDMQVPPAQTPPQEKTVDMTQQGAETAAPPRRPQTPPLRSAEKPPLPGGRVVSNGRGDRVLERRRPMYGAGLPEKEDNKVEITEHDETPTGESVQERLLRLREERRQNEIRKRNVEIGEDDA